MIALASLNNTAYLYRLNQMILVNLYNDYDLAFNVPHDYKMCHKILQCLNTLYNLHCRLDKIALTGLYPQRETSTAVTGL